MLEAVIAIGDAELGCGNAELAVLRGTDVRQHRDLHAAAEAEAPDTGNGRLWIIRQQGALRDTAFCIFFRRLGVVAGFFLRGVISAPKKSVFSRAATNEDTAIARCRRLSRG